MSGKVLHITEFEGQMVTLREAQDMPMWSSLHRRTAKEYT